MTEQRHYHRWPKPLDYEGEDITSYWPHIQHMVWSLPPALNVSFVWPAGTQVQAGTYRGFTTLKHVYPLTWGYYQINWFPPKGLTVSLILKFSLTEDQEWALMCTASIILFGSYMAGGGVKLWPNPAGSTRPPYSINLDMTMQQTAFPGTLAELQLYPIIPDEKWETSFVELEL